MSKVRFVVSSAIVLVTVCAALAAAENITAKKVFIKDNADPSKRQVQVQSVDAAVQFSATDDPATHGAALHVYSATDDFCVLLPAGASWVNKKNKAWKYKNKTTKNVAQVKNGKLLVTIRSGVTYTLSDNGTQGAVDVQLQFGTGARYCMRCRGNKKDEALKFLGKNCAVAACDPEPSSCAGATTGTTTPTTTTTLPSGGGLVLKGALTATPGRFNYNLMVGLPGANAACNTGFGGTHACTYAELQSAETAGDLAGLRDTGGNPVTSFWAIDSGQPPLQQCQDDVTSFLNWEYATAHTASRGQKVALTNGVLGLLQSSLQCNFSTAWVGCCQ
jgi:hypothetical protein